MKKTLTFLLVALASVSYAQIDWAIKSVKSPTELESTSSGTKFTVVLECENKGSETVKAGDTIAFNMLLIDIAGQSIILEYPPRASSGNLVLSLVTEDIAPGATYDLSLPELSTTAIVRNSLEVRLGFSSYLFNRTTLPNDVDSSNNVNFRDITWWNEYRNGVSVSELSYDKNIAVYPNPANDVLNVEIQKADIQNTTIELVDLTGKVIISEKVADVFAEGAFKLNVTDVQNGLYIVRVTSGDEISTTKVNIAH